MSTSFYKLIESDLLEYFALEDEDWRYRILSKLPTPHAKQLEVEQSRAKRKVLVAGRRAGKTTLATRKAIITALDGKRVLLTSTSQEQADAFWDKARSWLGDALGAKIVVKDEVRRTLDFKETGGHIRVKTARHPDALRGDYCDLFVGDEAARLLRSAWYEVVVPMLADTDGEAWLISTPNRMNWFFEVYQRGLDLDQERWRSWHFTTYDNPHLAPAAVAELTGDMDELSYRQEIMAEFLENDAAIFRNLDEALSAMSTTPHEHRGHRTVAGLDWGQMQDYTSISVFCVDCMREVLLDRWRRLRWQDQRERVKTIYAQWGIRPVLAEINSIGKPNVEALEDEGLAVEYFETTQISKAQVVQSLALAFERLEGRWLRDPVGKAELQSFEGRVSQNGRISYGAAEGSHDDTVIARALGWKAALGSGPLLGSELASAFGYGRQSGDEY